MSHAHFGGKFGIRRIREIFGRDSLFDNSMRLRTNSVSPDEISPDEISLDEISPDEISPAGRVSPINLIYPIYPIYPINPIEPIDLIHPVYPARSPSASNNQVGLDAMMDRLLFIQRLPDPSHYRE